MTRVAVVGTGFGCLTHARALKAAGFDVVALVGRDPRKTAARAERFSIPVAATSLDAVLEHVDAVTIATPPHTHADLVMQAVASGKHVLCEKPFARDVLEARAMRDAAEQAGVVHLLGTEFRFAPGQALLTRTVRAGAIGEPRLALFLLHIPLLADPAAEVPDWWADAAQGGGWLGAQASHAVDQVRTTLGEIVRVSATLSRVVDHGWTAEDAYLVHFEVAGGAAGIMQSVASDRGPMLFATRIVGSAGTAWAEGDRVQLADASGTRDVDMPSDLAVGAADPPPADLMHTAYDLLHSTGIDFGPYTQLARVFGEAIGGRSVDTFDPRPGTFSDGVASMAVVDAIRRSAREGTTVEVEVEVDA